MSRKAKNYKRDILPDPRFSDTLITKFINSMMWNGKKSVSERAFYGAIDQVAQRSNRDGVEVFHEAVENVRPLVEVRSRRVGGATYQVPTEVRPTRRDTLAIRWMIQSARSRGERGMLSRLANEIIDAAANRGGAVKKKEDTHKMAEANRAFAHYRW